MFILKCLLLLTSCYLSSANTVTPQFRSDYVYLKDLNAFYKEHTRSMNWHRAQKQCSLESAILLIPESKEEVDSVLQITSNTSSFWIGFHDFYTEGIFQTLDGRFASNMYIDWGNHQPDNYMGNQNCLHLLQNGKYDDGTCDVKLKFICKRKNIDINYNEKCSTHDPEYVYSKLSNNCYKIHSSPKSWHDAYLICLVEESSLVYVDDPGSKEFLFSLMARYPAENLIGDFQKNRIHFGFSDLLFNEDFITLKGERVSKNPQKVRWLPGKPDNSNNEHCGSMHRNGIIDTIDCNEKAMFICEK